MRQILVEHARARQAEKRGGGAPKLSLDEALDYAPSPFSLPPRIRWAFTKLLVLVRWRRQTEHPQVGDNVAIMLVRVRAIRHQHGNLTIPALHRTSSVRRLFEILRQRRFGGVG